MPQNMSKQRGKDIQIKEGAWALTLKYTFIEKYSSYRITSSMIVWHHLRHKNRNKKAKSAGLPEEPRVGIK